MPALNFMKQFAEAVESGEKKQTVRAHRKDGRPHCKVGDTLKLYTGMMHKSCRLLNEVKCTAVRPVTITETSMFLDGNLLPNSIFHRDQVEQTDNEIAEADGFDSFEAMSDWVQKSYGLPFEGVVIEWDAP